MFFDVVTEFARSASSSTSKLPQSCRKHLCSENVNQCERDGNSKPGNSHGHENFTNQITWKKEKKISVLAAIVSYGINNH